VIADALENLNKYGPIIPHSKEISDYFNKTNISSLETGKYQIAGESVYILIQEYLTKNDSEKKWESHKRYIDIQIVLSGQECIGYSPSHFLALEGEYSDEKDIMFYKNDTQQHCELLVPRDHFCLFFPGEAHKPGLHVSRRESVKKAVIKVMVD